MKTTIEVEGGKLYSIKDLLPAVENKYTFDVESFHKSGEPRVQRSICNNIYQVVSLLNKEMENLPNGSYIDEIESSEEKDTFYFMVRASIDHRNDYQLDIVISGISDASDFERLRKIV